MTRRSFIYGTLAAATAPAIGSEAKPIAQWYSFSRVFQKFGLEKAAEILSCAGYTGVEWTVRTGAGQVALTLEPRTMAFLCPDL